MEHTYLMTAKTIPFIFAVFGKLWTIASHLLEEPLTVSLIDLMSELFMRSCILIGGFLSVLDG